MPLTNSYNVAAQNNEQPEYQVLWEPIAVDPASAASVTFPTAAGAGAWVPGAILSYNTAGVGAYPPLGYGAAANQGGDSGNSGNPTFPNNWTVQYVDLAPVSTTTYLAGVFLGGPSLGAPLPVVPNTIPGGPAFSAMVGKRGIAQVLVDNSTTIGHTLNGSSTSGHTGQASDTGGSTWTFGTTIGIVLQAVTVSAGPVLCWAAVNFPH
jgi:hypothetical protein